MRFSTSPPRLVPPGHDRVDLVNKDDRAVIIGRVLLGVLEGAAEVRLGLARALRYNYLRVRAVDNKEVHTGIGGDRARHGRLAAPARASEEHSPGGVDA